MRAREIECALDWIRNPDVAADFENTNADGFGTVGSMPLSLRSPEQRASDLKNALDWVRKGQQEKNDPLGEFRKLDAMFPKKKGQTPEERARILEGALDWMRNSQISPYDPTLPPSFGKVGTVEVSQRTPEQRAKDLGDVLNWIRKKGQADGIMDPTGDFRKLDSVLPRKAGQTAEERAREIEGALDWCRNPVAGLDEGVVPTPLEKLHFAPVSRFAPEQRAKTMRDVFNWLRNNKADSDDETGDFKRVDQLLPKKRGQSTVDRAREIEGALDWMRNNGVSPMEDDVFDHFKKAGTVVQDALAAHTGKPAIVVANRTILAPNGK